MGNIGQDVRHKRLVSTEEQALRFERVFASQMKQSIRNIQNDITNLYIQYADNNGMSYADALKYLKKDDREEFQHGLTGLHLHDERRRLQV